MMMTGALKLITFDVAALLCQKDSKLRQQIRKITKVRFEDRDTKNAVQGHLLGGGGDYASNWWYRENNYHMIKRWLFVGRTISKTS